MNKHFSIYHQNYVNHILLALHNTYNMYNQLHLNVHKKPSQNSLAQFQQSQHRFWRQTRLLLPKDQLRSGLYYLALVAVNAEKCMQDFDL